MKRKYVSLAVLSVIAGITAISFRTLTNSDFEVSKNIEIFGSVYKEVQNLYVDEPQPGQLMKDGIDGMLKALDPYTVYIPESDIEEFRFMTTGQYGGIGSLIRTQEKYVVITDPYEGFPAHKAGLIAGDKILEIDGKSIEGKNSEEVSRVLKGQAGTPVKLKVQREGEKAAFEKTLIREEIKIKDVPYYGMLNETTGYIRLTSFTNTASSEVKAAFRELKDKKGMKKLVFDLRGNGGGLLNEAVNIVNLFVPRGQEIVSQKGRLSGMNVVYRAKEDPIDTEIPLVVLIDEGSASASEIVSGALQDLDRAVVVGQRSFGKGLVQQTRQLPYNAMVKITVARYYTPSGRCIQKLDYAHKDKEGHVSQFADSLIKTFDTPNKREVTDGRGVDPDIKVESPAYSKILSTLYAQHLIFDYATGFRRQHSTIAPASSFALTDAQYNDFLQYLSDKEYSYTTSSEQKFEELKTVAEKENYYAGAEQEFQHLLEKIKSDKQADLIRFGGEIREFLENEIVSRYYFQTGRMEASLRRDAVVTRALEVLGNESEYKAILRGEGDYKWIGHTKK